MRVKELNFGICVQSLRSIELNCIEYVSNKLLDIGQFMPEVHGATYHKTLIFNFVKLFIPMLRK
jgi:hypothetical protein